MQNDAGIIGVGPIYHIHAITALAIARTAEQAVESAFPACIWVDAYLVQGRGVGETELAGRKDLANEGSLDLEEGC